MEKQRFMGNLPKQINYRSGIGSEFSLALTRTRGNKYLVQPLAPEIDVRR
jgi:hypothetical protein